jgi:hypothetical protein
MQSFPSARFRQLWTILAEAGVAPGTRTRSAAHAVRHRVMRPEVAPSYFCLKCRISLSGIQAGFISQEGRGGPSLAIGASRRI